MQDFNIFSVLFMRDMSLPYLYPNGYLLILWQAEAVLRFAFSNLDYFEESSALWPRFIRRHVALFTPRIRKRHMSPKKTSVIDEAVNELQNWRAHNELTQREAAKVLSAHYFHVTYNSVRSWEGRYRRMTEDTAKILLKFLREHPQVTLASKKG
jgi:DNA-binding transcriptional regulator YiaG